MSWLFWDLLLSSIKPASDFGFSFSRLDSSQNEKTVVLAHCATFTVVVIGISILPDSGFQALWKRSHDRLPDGMWSVPWCKQSIVSNTFFPEELVSQKLCQLSLLFHCFVVSWRLSYHYSSEKQRSLSILLRTMNSKWGKKMLLWRLLVDNTLTFPVSIQLHPVPSLFVKSKKLNSCPSFWSNSFTRVEGI